MRCAAAAADAAAFNGDFYATERPRKDVIKAQVAISSGATDAV